MIFTGNPLASSQLRHKCTLLASLKSDFDIFKYFMFQLIVLFLFNAPPCDIVYSLLIHCFHQEKLFLNVLYLLV